MSDRKAVNRYYPPDFDPSKHKSINKYRNSHPLRERAKKLSQGILVIRFEMPYNIWCEGCGNHVGMGVRYNAEKKKVGNYYTTPIYQFKMKCHLCDNYYVIETDPQNCDYKIIKGARRKNQKWDMADNEQVLTEDREVIKKRSRDPMYKLEHGVEDGKKLKSVIPTLSQIEDMQDAWRDDYMQNKMLRNKFREEKKSLKIAEEQDQALLTKSSLDIPLVAESDEDKKLAALMKYNVVESFDDKQKHKRQEIKNRPLFVSSKPSAAISKEPSTSPNMAATSGKKNLQEIHKRLGLDRLKTSSPGGFGDAFDTTKSNLGLVVIKKKRKLDNTDAVVSSTPVNSKQSKSTTGGSVENLIACDGRSRHDDISNISPNSSRDSKMTCSNKSNHSETFENSQEHVKLQGESSKVNDLVSTLTHVDKLDGDGEQELDRSKVIVTGSEQPKSTRSLLLCDYTSSSDSD
ncbi:probable splicing factor YJU2B [Amphiura filiformis]|uniref:probable splicing factor YJU2B n=1 Tax=Amphiura filiformis TaxID=82378 RepID=UPI003B20DE59